MSEPRRRAGPVVLAGLVLLGLVAVLTAVGGPAAVASYRHAQKVAERFGETPDMAAWLPLTTDGMLVLALIVMYARRLRHEPVGRAPWVAFAAGTAATLAANLAAADLAHAPNRWEIGGRLAVAVWPPIAFALTLELLALLLPLVRGLLLSAVREPVREDVSTEDAPVPAPPPVREHAPKRPSGPRTASTPTTGRVDLTKPVYPTGTNGATVRTAGPPDREPAPDREYADRPDGWTADDERIRREYIRLGSVLFEDGPPSQRAVRSDHGVGPVRARRIVESLTVEAVR